MRSIQWLGVSLLAASLLFCGCGRSIQRPSALNYTLSSAVYVKGVAITPDNPTSTGGAVTSYTVSPALPLGLSLDTGSGVISGTPAAVSKSAAYVVSASNKRGSTTQALTLAVNPGPLSSNDLNLIFVVSEDSGYQAAGDVNPSTGNLTGQGLRRSLLMATFLQQQVLGMKNVTGIYALSPMTHLQTTNGYPDMAPLESIQQFAMLNQITLSSDAVGGTPYTGNSYPVNVSYAPGTLPIGVVTPSLLCGTCQGLDFNDLDEDNETVLKAIILANAPGFHVFSAPWETTSKLLANIDSIEGYQLAVPDAYAGPNNVYALSVTPSGGVSLSTFNANLKPPSGYPALPSPVVSSGCPAKTTPFKIVVTGGIDGAVVPAGINKHETLYLMRHVNAHPQGYWGDGSYVAAGQWRALDLPIALEGKIAPDQVWSIDPAQVTGGTVSASGDHDWSNVAPSLSAEPYAIANGLPYNLVASFEIVPSNSPGLAADLFLNDGKFSNHKVLLAWQYVQIPQTVNLLLASYFPQGAGHPPPRYTAPDWPASDYDTVWTVTLDAVGNVTIDNAVCEGIDSAALPATAPQF